MAKQPPAKKPSQKPLTAKTPAKNPAGKAVPKAAPKAASAKKAAAPKQAGGPKKPTAAKVAPKQAPQKSGKASAQKASTGHQRAQQRRSPGAVSNQNVGASEAKPAKKGGGFIKFVAFCALVPIAALVVYIQFFGDEDQKLKGYDKDSLTSFMNTVVDEGKNQSENIKQNVEENVVPVLEEKGGKAYQAIKLGVGTMVNIAASTIEKWGKEKAALKEEIEGNEALKKKFDDFNAKGLSDFEKEISESQQVAVAEEPRPPVVEEKPLVVESKLRGASFDEAKDGIEYAQRLLGRAKTMKSDERFDVYKRADKKLERSHSYFERSLAKLDTEDDKRRANGYMTKITKLRNSFKDVLPEEVVAQVATAEEPVAEAEAKPPIAEKKPEPVQVAVNTVKESKPPVKKKAEKKTPKKKTVRVTGIKADKNFQEADKKLAEGLTWYKKAGPDVSQNTRNKNLKQALVRFDSALQSFNKVDDSKKYKGKKDQLVLEERFEKVMFLRYACMKTMTL